MELRDFLRLLRRLWWVPAALLLMGSIAGWVLAPATPYKSMFRAVVVMPGDTEDPGSSERPELMILDDLLPLVRSRAFAERTIEAIPAGNRDALTVPEVQAALDQSRYGRVATVTGSGSDPAEVAAIVSAAAVVFPDAVNTYLVAPGGEPASVQVLDPPSPPERSFTRRNLVVGAAAFAAGMAGLWIVWLVGARRLRATTDARSI